ncbi:hypothetical protein K661_01681 [Piscirickettsia salmonis LF-89 = ATCC VR-1361]|nr:hypothetical protein K661_01681 [Piscirickettsia salmonis LF-89 = ATCC VR-1361]
MESFYKKCLKIVRLFFNGECDLIKLTDFFPCYYYCIPI